MCKINEPSWQAKKTKSYFEGGKLKRTNKIYRSGSKGKIFHSEMERGDKMKRERKHESEAVGRMRVGGFCRHSALRPTPVPSALTYFQSGFYLDQTRAIAKSFFFSFICRLFMTLLESWNCFNHRISRTNAIFKNLLHPCACSHIKSPQLDH